LASPVEIALSLLVLICQRDDCIDERQSMILHRRGGRNTSDEICPFSPLCQVALGFD